MSDATLPTAQLPVVRVLRTTPLFLCPSLALILVKNSCDSIRLCVCPLYGNVFLHTMIPTGRISHMETIATTLVLARFVRLRKTTFSYSGACYGTTPGTPGQRSTETAAGICWALYVSPRSWWVARFLRMLTPIIDRDSCRWMPSAWDVQRSNREVMPRSTNSEGIPG